MTTTVEAVYEAGVLRLLGPVALAEGARVAVTLDDDALPERTDAAYLLTLPRAEHELMAFTALDGELFLD